MIFASSSMISCGCKAGSFAGRNITVRISIAASKSNKIPEIIHPIILITIPSGTLILRAPSVISTPTGTSTPTEPARGHGEEQACHEDKRCDRYLPVLADIDDGETAEECGQDVVKAGASAGESRIGASTDNAATPRMMTTVVTMELVAIAIRRDDLPSSVPGFAFAFSMAFKALGALMLVRFPVTNARYVPPFRASACR